MTVTLALIEKVLGMLFILCGSIAICFFMAGANSDISSPYLLLIVCGVVAYLVAALVTMALVPNFPCK